MGGLWSDHRYFLYIYRVLGAFVILTGLLLYSMGRNIRKNRAVLQTLQWGFVLVGVVMVLAGYFSGLHPFFYIPDFVFCFFIAGLLYWVNHGKATGR
jgi:peptidoglycan/LPS O-acetylase OafA/YrhL